MNILSGEQATVTVTFPASGSLMFLFRYHADRRQAGLLNVAS